MNSSPRPTGWSAGTQKPITSTSAHVSRTTSLSRLPSSVRGLCRPGVSITISWASGRCRMPRMAWRVVCGRLEVIATFCPISAFVSVDLPAFGPADEAGEAGPETLRHLGEVTPPPRFRRQRANVPRQQLRSQGPQLLARERLEDLPADRQRRGRGRGRRVEHVQHRPGCPNDRHSPGRRTGSRRPGCRPAAPPGPAPRHRPGAGRRPGRRAAAAGSGGPSPRATATGASRRARSASAAARAAASRGRPATRAAPCGFTTPHE